MSDELKVVAWECIAKPDGWNGLPPKEHVAAMVDDFRADNPYWEAYKPLAYKGDAERLLAKRDAKIAELGRSLDEASKMLSAISPRAVELAKRVDELERERDEAQAHLRAVVAEVQGLIDESHGVYGLHLNGDAAPWSEIVGGGRFERIASVDAALEYIDSAMKEGES